MESSRLAAIDVPSRTMPVLWAQGSDGSVLKARTPVPKVSKVMKGIVTSTVFTGQYLPLGKNRFQ
jgi:hypothetical protein